GTMGRRLLRSLGEGHLIQAHAIATVLDSLGLDTEVRVDPELPHFVLLMVRNPYRRTADAVGFIYWYREHDLRVQGSVFRGGTKPEMRVWWTGQEHSPYTLGVVDHSRDESKMYLSLYRLSPSGWAMDGEWAVGRRPGRSSWRAPTHRGRVGSRCDSEAHAAHAVMWFASNSRAGVGSSLAGRRARFRHRRRPRRDRGLDDAPP